MTCSYTDCKNDPVVNTKLRHYNVSLCKLHLLLLREVVAHEENVAYEDGKEMWRQHKTVVKEGGVNETWFDKDPGTTADTTSPTRSAPGDSAGGSSAT